MAITVSIVDPATLAVAAIGGYLLGAVPFGLVLTRLAGLGDIRTIGSGNIGATNVLRTGRKDLAAATLVLDSAKGAAAALMAMWLSADGAHFTQTGAMLAAGVAAVVGHNFPVWLRFRGGKGVATTLGVLIAAAWPVGAVACATWLVVASLTRYSSLAALVALMTAPMWALHFAAPAHAAAFTVLAALGAVRHRANIARLLNGTEARISFGERSQPADG